MNRLLRVALVALFSLVCHVAYAQHCAPVFGSYLSEISVKRSKAGIKLKVEYTLQGGQGQNAYQAYILAYLDRDATKVPAPKGQDLIDTKVALVLHTQLMKRNKEGVFDLEFQIDDTELAKKVISHRGLTEKDRTEYGGYGIYKDTLRIAVFVPLLDDKKYSVIEGLPEDRHYCNYDESRALLFQALPYRFSLHFGVVRAVRLAPGRFKIEINGDKPG